MLGWYTLLFSLFKGSFSIPDAVIYTLSSLIVVFLTLPIHEYAHGFAAVKLGDPTPRYQGRMTLNPFAHIDYMGAACIILFGFGWAKPVQINTNYFKNPKRDMAITALAGPLSNLVVALVALLFMNGFALVWSNTSLTIFIYIYTFFKFIANINVYLAVFNLIPIPPLDGSRLLSALLPNRQYYALMRYERYLFLAVLALLWIGVLDVPLQFLSSRILTGLNFIASLPFRLF